MRFHTELFPRGQDPFKEMAGTEPEIFWVQNVYSFTEIWAPFPQISGTSRAQHGRLLKAAWGTWGEPLKAQ